MVPKQRKKSEVLPPGTSLDGRSANSKYWGKKNGLAKMCPHPKPDGGGQCGLEAAHCKCLCKLCKTPMRARKRCPNQRCTWGHDRSAEVSSAEISPEDPVPPRARPWWRGAPDAIHPLPGPMPSVPRDADPAFHPLLQHSMLVPGGPDPPMPKRRETRGRKPKPVKPRNNSELDLTPTGSPVPGPANVRAATSWNRTKFATMPPSMSVAPPPPL